MQTLISPTTHFHNIYTMQYYTIYKGRWYSILNLHNMHTMQHNTDNREQLVFILSSLSTIMIIRTMQFKIIHSETDWDLHAVLAIHTHNPHWNSQWNWWYTQSTLKSQHFILYSDNNTHVLVYALRHMAFSNFCFLVHIMSKTSGVQSTR